MANEFDPFKNVQLFQKKIEKVFNNFHEPYGHITHNVKSVNLEFNLPGVKEKDLDLRINPKSVEIKAESKSVKVKKERGNFSETKNYLRYHRKISLPSGLNVEKAKARFTGGMLYIKIPKQSFRKKKS